MDSVIDLYHGSRKNFSLFDPEYYQSGEGAGDYKGWYFCSTQKGALCHCKNYLKCEVRQNEGFVLHCQIEKIFISEDIDDMYTEPCYGRPVYGVLLEDSQKIKIVRVIPAREVFESVYGAIID
jgi:hypothetical protein